MNLVLLGPPGAGKGTLANSLKKSLNIPHISTGDILREEMKDDTPLGREVKLFIESGKLVPDEVVTKLIGHKFSSDCSINAGYMLDGYPRTETQAADLDKILDNLGKKLDCAIYLECSLPIVIQRLTGRRICRQCGALFHMTNKPPKNVGICDDCGGEVYQRPDDNEETIKTRMDVYLNNTKPIVDYYKTQGKLKKVDADKDSQEVQGILMKIFNED